MFYHQFPYDLIAIDWGVPLINPCPPVCQDTVCLIHATSPIPLRATAGRPSTWNEVLTGHGKAILDAKLGQCLDEWHAASEQLIVICIKGLKRHVLNRQLPSLWKQHLECMPKLSELPLMSTFKTPANRGIHI